MPPGLQTYRADIDGLRAVAVIAVVLNHLDHRLLPGGYLGVDIFFVISGFVITTSLKERPAERLSDLLGDFFARRFRRLVPALALCTVASGIAAWLVDPTPYASLHTGLAALIGLSNFQLLSTSQDYFAAATSLNLFTQTWSLGVEEQFYLLFPLLVWASGLSRSASGARRLFLACLGLSLLSVVALLLLPGKAGGAAYFLVFGRLWELGCGCMAALMRPLERSIYAWLGLVGIALNLGLPLPPSALTGLWAVPPTVVLILSGGAPKFLAQRPVVALGRMSYSLYLWHWPVVSAGLLAFGQFRWHIPAELTVMFLLATPSYMLVERPARTKLAALPRRWSAVTALACVLTAGGVLAALLHWPNPAPFVERRFAEVPPWFLPFPGSGADHMTECVVDGNIHLTRPTTFDRCTLPPRAGAANTVWAMGDSHAGHLQGLLVALHEQIGLGIHLIETPGFAFPPTPGAQLPDRDAFFAKTLERARPGDIILIGHLFLSRQGAIEPRPGLAPWIASVEALAASLRPRGIHVVIVGPPPIFRFASIFSCAPGQDGTTNCDIPRKELAIAVEPVEAELTAATRRQSNLHLFKTFTILCPPAEDTCKPVRAGVLRFRDQDHFNAAGSAGLAPAFAEFLRTLTVPTQGSQ